MPTRRLAAVVALALAVAACGNAGSKKTSGTKTTGTGDTSSRSSGQREVNQPGVTKDTIRVGGVASKTNPLNGPYAAAFDGVKAYFNMVNSSGGIYGRKLALVAERDDQVTNNQQEVQGLLDQDNVFAVLPVATIFSFGGSKALAAQKVPTFGWNILQEWTGPPNLFGFGGSNCLDCITPALPEEMKLIGSKKLGILAYNVANSKSCADVTAKTFDKYPVAKVVYVTTSLSFGVADFSADVKTMKDKGVDAVTTCMDQNAVLNLAKEMKKQGLDAVQYMPNAYDQKFVEANKEFFAGAVVRVSFTPFEFRPRPKGMVEFNKWMDKAGYTKNEVSMIGWIDADLFVAGLRRAGPDFTRQKVIDALNAPAMKDYDAQGLAPPDETVNHTKVSQLTCEAYVKIDKSGKFVPVFTEPGKPFACWPANPDTLPADVIHK